MTERRQWMIAISLVWFVLWLGFGLAFSHRAYASAFPPGVYMFTGDTAKFTNIRPGMNHRYGPAELFNPLNVSCATIYTGRTELSPSNANSYFDDNSAFTEYWESGSVSSTDTSPAAVIYAVKWTRDYYQEGSPLPVAGYDDQRSLWFDGQYLYQFLRGSGDKWPCAYPTSTPRYVKGSYRLGGVTDYQSPSGPVESLGFSSVTRLLVKYSRQTSPSVGWDVSWKMGTGYTGSGDQWSVTSGSWTHSSPGINPTVTIDGQWSANSHALLTGDGKVSAATDGQYADALAKTGSDAIAHEYTERVECSSARFLTTDTAQAFFDATSVTSTATPRSFDSSDTALTDTGLDNMLPDWVQRPARQLTSGVSDFTSGFSGWLWWLNPWDDLTGVTP